MIKSMTGFASVSREVDGVTIGVTVRSVNHRYLDLQLRVAHQFGAQESELRAAVKRRVARGRVELAVTVRSMRPPAVDVVLNESLVEALATALTEAQTRGLTAGKLTAGDLLRFPQAIVVEEREITDVAQELLSQAVVEVVEQGLGELDAMRMQEGQYLRTDLDGRCVTVGELVERLRTEAKTGQAEVVTRLTTRIEELRAQLGADEPQVAQELVRFAARSDVSEELTRLRGHLAHWATLSDAPEPCGRKLDFLLQEMNREINTLGAKIEGSSVSELIVAAKAELEKMREQVQNVE